VIERHRDLNKKLSLRLSEFDVKVDYIMGLLGVLDNRVDGADRTIENLQEEIDALKKASDERTDYEGEARNKISAKKRKSRSG
jgi:FtsZ-binding cell division protein ZapB